MTEECHPQVCVFFCSNCLDGAAVAGFCEQLGLDAKMTISLPCAGKVNVPYLIKAFETGADAVVVLTCEMDACRHLEGNRRAKKRVQAVDSLLDEIGMGSGRIAVFEIKEGERERTMALLKEFCENIERILVTEGERVTK